MVAAEMVLPEGGWRDAGRYTGVRGGGARAIFSGIKEEGQEPDKLTYGRSGKL